MLDLCITHPKTPVETRLRTVRTRTWVQGQSVVLEVTFVGAAFSRSRKFTVKTEAGDNVAAQEAAQEAAACRMIDLTNAAVDKAAHLAGRWKRNVCRSLALYHLADWTDPPSTLDVNNFVSYWAYRYIVDMGVNVLA